MREAPKTPAEIREDLEYRNKLLAKFMGWWMEEDQPGTWFERTTHAIYVAYSVQTSYPYRDLPFKHDPKYLMKVMEKFRTTVKGSSDGETKGAKVGQYFIDRFEIGRNVFFGTIIQWTRKGWRMFNDANKELCSYRMIGENCEDWQEGLFYFLSDLIIPIAEGMKEPRNPNIELKLKKNELKRKIH